MVFKARMADAKIWKNLISAIATLVDEASFNINEEGIQLRAMDPSHVAMVDFEWPKTSFEEYICDEPTKLSVNVSEMLKLLRRIGGEESIELVLEPSNPKLMMVLKSNYTRTFGMSTLEPSTEEFPTPKISFSTLTRLTTSLLKNALEDATAVSDQIIFDASSDRLTMRATGYLGNVVVEVEKGTDELLNLETKENSRSTFSLSYLSEMVKAASNLSDVVTLEFSTDMPIRLNFELTSKGKLQYYLAPRIESG